MRYRPEFQDKLNVFSSTNQSTVSRVVNSDDLGGFVTKLDQVLSIILRRMFSALLMSALNAASFLRCVQTTLNTLLLSSIQTEQDECLGFKRRCDP